MSGTPGYDLTRRTLLGGAFAAAGGLLVSGCSDTQVASGQGTTGGRSGGTLKIGTPTDVVLSTILRFQANNQPLRRTVFEYVVDRKPDGTYAPYLATKWTFSDDNRKLVLDLRDNVIFHSGRAFGPEDVIASIKAALEPASGAQAAKLFAAAKSMDVTGVHQLTVTFDKPSTTFLDGLAMLPIIDKDTYPKITDAKQVIGTGPYVWDTWKSGSSLLLKRNEKYWQPGLPYLDQLVFTVIADPQALVAALRSGDAQLAMRMVARDGASLAKDARFKVDTTATYETYLGANTQVKPLDDVRVRQAIAYALDRQRIVDQVYAGYATPSSVPWADGTPGVTAAQRNHYATDLAKAKSLLEQAGAVGAEVAISSLSAEPTTGAVLQVVQYDLQQLGLKPKVVSYDAAQFASVLQAGKFPGLWITDVALTAMGQVTALLTANPLTTGKNTENFTAPEYTQLVNDLVSVTASGQSPAAASGKLTDYMLEQAFHTSLAQIQTLVTHSTAVSGVTSDLTLALDFTQAKVSS